MKMSTRSWVEAIGAVALLAGLALVWVQIRQSTEITRIQLANSVQQNWRSVDGTRQSEEFAKVLAKSIEAPQALTLAEFFELDAYYLGVVDQLEAVADQFEKGFRTGSLEQGISNNVQIYFGNAFAKAWVNAHFDDLTSRDAAWVKILLAAVQEVDSNAIETNYRGILSDVQKLTDGAMK